MADLPRLLLTAGDVAGIGPEIIVRAWPELLSVCRPVVVSDRHSLERAILASRSNPGPQASRAIAVGTNVSVNASATQTRQETRIEDVATPEEARPTAEVIPCLEATSQDLRGVVPGRIDAAAGRAAYDFLVAAIDLTLGGRADGIVTAPLQKEGLHAAGLKYPGHTEILAERTGTRNFAMMLYARGPQIPHGLGVVHVTLHMALRDVFARLTTAAVLEKIHLLDGVMRRLKDQSPRLVVAALNPHASDGGLFGDEETRLIEPAVAQARAAGVDVVGPLPSDTLFVRAQRGDFDGVVAMYHDQGHIPLKLLSGLQAVNISVGLPLVRTSVAHGTAYDIAGKGIADHRSLVEAVHVAAKLIRSQGTRR